MSGADFSSSNNAEFLVGESGSTQQNRVRVQKVQGLDRQAKSTATLTLASCALLVLLVLLVLVLLVLLLLLPPPRLLLLTFFVLEIMNIKVTDTYYRERRCSFVLLLRNNPTNYYS